MGTFVRLPVGLTASGGDRLLECLGDTVAKVLEQAITAEPRLRTRIFRDDGRVYAGVFLNGRNINAYDGMDTPVRDGDTISIMPPMSGG
jgi:sulfur-carrier protein